MCERYALTSSREALAALLGAVAATDFPPRYNISPGHTVQAAFAEHARRLLAPVRFGFAPIQTGEDRHAPLAFNVRAETAAQRPAFRPALQATRCLVPADAWYAWRAIGRFRQPYMARRVDRATMMFAGLWQNYGRPDGSTARAVAILTTAAGEDTAHIHDRMPAVLTPDHWEAWLDPRVDGASLAMRCLAPAPPGTFETLAIAALINQIGNDGPEVQERAPERTTHEPSQPRPV